MTGAADIVDRDVDPGEGRAAARPSPPSAATGRDIGRADER